MPAIINTIIPKQGFEQVRDVIGAILILELTKQKELQGVDFPEAVSVYSERITPISNEEQVYVNVLLDSATYDNFTQSDMQGRTIYFIDVFTTGEGSAERTGSDDSSIRLHKFIGMIRYILSFTGYNTLGLEAGLIAGRYLESFSTLDPSAHAENTEFVRMARIQVAVRILEGQELWDGVPFGGSTTQVKLDLTEHGYQYQLVV